MSYQYDANARIWAKPVTTSIAYSDGDKPEEYLRSLLKNSTDVSANSAELRSGIRDWESEYHLSPTRHNLLRPIAINSTHKVLELGCGCGALTRYLGETGATVFAVEGSLRRAEIAADRCRDLINVAVYCDNISALELERASFDVVTLIGVLEYANLFIPSANPVQACLELARSWLKPNGRLLIAIENQLGLKYFAGCREDHVGTPYFGIQNLYTPKTVQTFGRRELQQRICDAGFTSTEFLYPFPDYKLPKLTVHEAAFSQPGFSVSSLLTGLFNGDHREEQHRHFEDTLVWDSLERNGMLQDMANSFLVIARQQASHVRPSCLATLFSDSRQTRFASETRFECFNAKVQVSKYPLYPHAESPPSSSISQTLEKNLPYIQGASYVQPLLTRLADGAGIKEVAAWAQPWLEYLEHNAEANLLPVDHIDAIPCNLIVQPDGALALIDREWRLSTPPSLAWVFVRGFVHTLQKAPAAPALHNLSYRQLISMVANIIAPNIAIDFTSVAKQEDALQNEICRSKLGECAFSEILDIPLGKLIPGNTLPDDHRVIKDELQRTHNSLSWRLTLPLRLLDQVWQKRRKKQRHV